MGTARALPPSSVWSQETQPVLLRLRVAWQTPGRVGIQVTVTLPLSSVPQTWTQSPEPRRARRARTGHWL